jgi:hypothetical protein
LLQVLVRKTEISTVALRPGEGLLVGQAGISQAAMSALRNVQNVTRGGKSAKSNPSSTSDDSAATATAEMRRRVQMGIARACASFNDIEVSVEYLKRLEKQLLQEVDGSFPPQDTITEQLIMCVKSLDGVVDSFVESSDQALAQLLSQILPRVRSIVNDAVGQDGSSAFSGLSGGSTSAGNVNLRMNYEMDEDAYESAQVSEGYMDRLLSNLDELINPLRVHLMPRLADKLILGAISGASKRLEMALRRSQCSLLGALCLKADVKFLASYAIERLHSKEINTNAGLLKVCPPLARLVQIATLMNVEELDEVLDLISTSRRRGNWDLKLDDCKTFLNLRVEFEGRKVNEMLRISEGEGKAV